MLLKVTQGLGFGHILVIMFITMYSRVLATGCATRDQATLQEFQNTNQSPETTWGPHIPIYIHVVPDHDRCFSPLIYILNLRTVIRLNA